VYRLGSLPVAVPTAVAVYRLGFLPVAMPTAVVVYRLGSLLVAVLTEAAFPLDSLPVAAPTMAVFPLDSPLAAVHMAAAAQDLLLLPRAVRTAVLWAPVVQTDAPTLLL